MRTNRAFIKVDIELVQFIGLEATFLYGALCNISNIKSVDDKGYFTVETSYLCRVTGWSRWTLIRHRNKLIEADLIRLKSGVNQNIKVKYKLIQKLT